MELDREFYEDHEPDWMYMMFWDNKCAIVDTSDDSEEVKSNIKQG
jgi:hypothetical protein